MEADGRPELRLGLVLYGGVSLAVYIYGVVFEVQRLLTASPDSAYGRALRDAGLSRAVVDVIAGTSAGGINGILLAKALAAGADVREVRDLWIDGGDIGRLMHGLDEENPASLLSTEQFEGRLRDGFARLDAAGGGQKSEDVLDLFVSTTHLRGDRRQFMDSMGRSIQTLVHRFVVHLKQRRYGRNDFHDPARAEEVNEELVRLSRATSAFPVAFQPVLLEGEKLLGRKAERSGWFADGGVLNNKPFTEALRTIFTRASPEAPARRWLLSVDPDPKTIPPSTGPGSEPAFDQVLGAAAAGIPRYQSLASDLEALEAHNASVRRVNRTVLDLEVGFARSGGTAGSPLSPGVDTAYRDLRRRSLAQQLAEQLMEAARPVDRTAFDPEATVAAFAEGASRAVVEWEEGQARDAEGRYVEAIAVEADPAFQRRRIYYLIKLLGMSRDREGEEGDGLRAARKALWEAFDRISNLLWESFAAEDLVLGEVESRELDGPPLDAHRQAFEVARGEVGSRWEGMGPRLADLLGGLRARLEPVTVALPVGDGAEGDAVDVPLLDVFDGFFIRDLFLLTVESGGGVRFRDLVDHAQISPESATATKVEAGMKLAGDTAGHFGGFLERSWRLNDLRWGRLDTGEVLIKAILGQAPPERQEQALEEVCREVLEEECPEALRAADWRRYLAEHALGDATLKSLTKERQVGLTYRAAVVLRRMLTRARVDADRTAPEKDLRARALRSLDGGLRRLLAFLILPRLALERRWRRYARKTEVPDD